LAWRISGAEAATTVSGQINATLTLTNSCQINGAAPGPGTTNFGTLNFGTQTAQFATATGQVMNSSGTAVTVLCSPGSAPTFKVLAGTNDGKGTGGSRALSDGATHFVGYDLFSDAAFANVLAANAVINLGTSTGVAQAVNVYGKAVGATGLPAGTYTDIVAVELSF